MSQGEGKKDETSNSFDQKQTHFGSGNACLEKGGHCRGKDFFSKRARNKGGLSTGAIVGIAVGSVAVAGLGGFAIFWFLIAKERLEIK